MARAQVLRTASVAQSAALGNPVNGLESRPSLNAQDLHAIQRARRWWMATSSPVRSGGDYCETLECCLVEFGWEEKRALQGHEIDGRYHGVDVACFIEGPGYIATQGQ
jgi:hypothetical protein